MKKPSFYKACIVTFPSVIILSVLSFSVVHIFQSNGLIWKTLLIPSIILLFPMMFLIQGVFCATNHISVFIASGLSLFTFTLTLYNCFQTVAATSICLYAVSSVLGYAISRIFMKY